MTEISLLAGVDVLIDPPPKPAFIATPTTDTVVVPLAGPTGNTGTQGQMGPPGPPGEPGNPDDLPSLTLLFENGLI